MSNIDSARKLIDEGRHAEALDELSRLEPEYRDNRGYWLLRSSSHSELSDYEAAESACRKCIDLDPECAAAHSGLGRALEEQGQLKESLAAFDAAIGRQPTPSRYVLRGSIRCRLDRISEGIEDYRKAIDLDPDFSEGHLNLGIELRLDGDSGASAHLQRAFELAPDDPLTIRELGTVKYGEGDLDEARVLLERAVELDPNEPWGHITLAGLYDDLEQPENAVEALKAARSCGQLLDLVEGRLGRLLSRLGRTTEAKLCLEEALRHEPGDPLASFHLAELLISDDVDRARALLRSCVDAASARYSAEAEALLKEL